jgi:thiamine-phosphate pyrophosphorylase
MSACSAKPPNEESFMMSQDEARLFLITPPIDDAAAFAPLLESALTTCDIACVLLRTAARDDTERKSIIKSMAPIAQKLNVACLAANDPALAVRADADGVHIDGDLEEIEEAIRALHPSRIVGAGGMTTRDAAMTAGEAGVDYLMFGSPSGTEPHAAIVERVAWWAEIFNVPCIGYAHELGGIADLVRAGADFVALGDAVFLDPRGIVVALREAAFALAQAREPA